MKTKFLLLIITIGIIANACKSAPTNIPEGTWNYDLIVNSVKAGKAVFSSTVSNNNYVVRTEMYLSVGPIENKSVSIITETKDFKPVKLEEYNTITDKTSGKVQEIKRVAVFEGDNVTLQAGDKKSVFKIDKNFILNGNYFISELIKNQFKQGTIVEAHLYEPLVEIDTPILSIAEVKGFTSVKVGGKSMKLLNLKLRIENLKSIDLYLNEHGVTEKMVMKMLNNEFVMERIE
jgi:translation initiation factor IF-1